MIELVGLLCLLVALVIMVPVGRSIWRRPPISVRLMVTKWFRVTVEWSQIEEPAGRSGSSSRPGDPQPPPR
jgi:hypothetical protein